MAGFAGHRPASQVAPVRVPLDKGHLLRFGSPAPAWERPLDAGVVLSGGRAVRRRRGPANGLYLVWFLSGSKKLESGFGARSFLEGDTLVLPHGVPFVSDERPGADGDFLAVRFEFEASLLRQLARAESTVAAAMAAGTVDAPRGVLKPRPDANVTDAMARCVDYAVGGLRSTALARRRLEDVLVALAEADPRAVSALASERELASLLEGLLQSAPGAPWGLIKAATALGVSPATLKRRLAERGLTFSALLTRARLDEGRRLLTGQGLSVLEAALSVGYGSPSKFAAAYRRRFGRPPEQDKTTRRP